VNRKVEQMRSRVEVKRMRSEVKWIKEEENASEEKNLWAWENSGRTGDVE